MTVLQAARVRCDRCSREDRCEVQLEIWPNGAVAGDVRLPEGWKRERAHGTGARGVRDRGSIGAVCDRCRL